MSRKWKSVALLFLLVAAARRAKGAAPGTTPALSPLQSFSLEELVALARSVGFPDPELAAAVAMAESSGQSWVSGDNGASLGLWQIHTTTHPEFERSKLTD